MLQEVILEDIALCDERNKDDDHQYGFDVLCRGVVDLIGGPQRQCKGYKMDRLPRQLGNIFSGYRRPCAAVKPRPASKAMSKYRSRLEVQPFFATNRDAFTASGYFVGCRSGK